jgi:NTP pyrophosphatase (non-canonical NTP hydrolase)
MSSYLQSMVEFADKFTDLARDQASWSQATFGSDDDRGPLGPLKHLEKEAREAQSAVGSAELREELADCFILILDASRRAGIKPMQLVEASQEKMAKNRKRTWPKPIPDEPVEHLGDTPET